VNVDYLVEEWFTTDSSRVNRAFDNLVTMIIDAPDVPIEDIDKWVVAYNQLPRTGRDYRKPRQRGPRKLTFRQEMALQLAANGLKEKEIAVRMFVSRETVKNHLAACRYKLKALNTPHAVAIALRQEIIE